MKLNMGPLDRKIRTFAVAPALVIVGVLLGPGGLLSVILYALAGVMVATSAVGSCPLYAVFGIKTCPVALASTESNTVR